jgi:hypothetical protein
MCPLGAALRGRIAAEPSGNEGGMEGEELHRARAAMVLQAILRHGLS